MCNDKSAHLFTLIYKFYSPVTKYVYILRAEYHEQHVFVVKFYAKKDRKSDDKYSKILNKGDIYNVLITCLKIVQIISEKYHDVSFGFIGSRTIDRRSNTVENYENTQRFRIYKKIVENKIGFETFDHFVYGVVSGYLLVNKNGDDVELKEQLITTMFVDTYNNLLQI